MEQSGGLGHHNMHGLHIMACLTFVYVKGMESCPFPSSRRRQELSDSREFFNVPVIQTNQSVPLHSISCVLVRDLANDIAPFACVLLVGYYSGICVALCDNPLPILTKNLTSTRTYTGRGRAFA
jgi:hypothetical protein